MRNQNVSWAAFFLVQIFAQMRHKDNFSLLHKVPFFKGKKNLSCLKMLCKEVVICGRDFLFWSTNFVLVTFGQHGQLVEKSGTNECEIFLGMLATLMLNH
jgi:hypothetical protein